MKYFKSSNIIVPAIIFCWLFLIFIINPVGEFPFGDDWAYAGPVKHFLESGQIKITDWSSMTLIGWIYIGAFTSWLFGFSFTVLRLTALFMGLAGVLGTYFLFAEFNIKKEYALLGALTLAFHPAFFLLSYSFATDIPFYAFFVWALFFFIKFMKHENTSDKAIKQSGKNKSWIYFIIGCILSIIAVLIRDLAIIIPVAFAIGYFYRNGINRRSIFITIITVVLIWGAFIIFRYWLESVHGLPRNMDFSRKKMLSVWTSGLGYLLLIYIKNIVYTIIYGGLYASPVIIAVFLNRYRTFSTKIMRFLFSAAFLFTAVIVLLCKFVVKIHAQIEDMLTNHIWLHNFAFADVNNPSNDSVFQIPGYLSMSFIIAGSILGIIMFFLLSIKAGEYLKENKNNIFGRKEGITEILILLLLAYCGIIFSQMVMGRYLILPVIFIALLLLKGEKFGRLSILPKKLAIGLSVIFLAYSSISAAHDMLAFNRARFSALEYLNNNMKISPERIDGGLEYNAWHFYNFDFKSKPDMNWWWVQNNDYIVSWGKCKNFAIIKEYEYNRWYPPGFKSKIFIEKKM